MLYNPASLDIQHIQKCMQLVWLLLLPWRTGTAQVVRARYFWVHLIIRDCEVWKNRDRNKAVFSKMKWVMRTKNQIHEREYNDIYDHNHEWQVKSASMTDADFTDWLHCICQIKAQKAKLPPYLPFPFPPTSSYFVPSASLSFLILPPSPFLPHVLSIHCLSMTHLPCLPLTRLSSASGGFAYWSWSRTQKEGG